MILRCSAYAAMGGVWFSFKLAKEGQPGAELVFNEIYSLSLDDEDMSRKEALEVLIQGLQCMHADL